MKQLISFTAARKGSTIIIKYLVMSVTFNLWNNSAFYANIPRIAYAVQVIVQVTLLLSVDNPQCHDKSMQNG